MQRILFFLLIFPFQGGYSQDKPFNFLPKTDSLYQIIHYGHYSLAYSETHEQAYWVAYELTKGEVDSNGFSRTNDFRADPNVYPGSATLVDYKGSGYDRGHLAPAGDFAFSANAMSESFYMTNMSPQQPGFNRGVWRKLESLVRAWATENESLYIVTGAILTDSLQTIGINGVSVPNHFYKIILDYTVPDIKAIAFLMENTGSTSPLHHFVVPIDSLEILTGIDFFPELGDDLECYLESNISLSSWTWKSDTIDPPITAEIEKEKVGLSCRGIDKLTGKECKIRSLPSKGYCRHPTYPPKQKLNLFWGLNGIEQRIFDFEIFRSLQ